jgi:hypothetical protein
MVIHGRDDDARRAVFAFLLALGLEPISWEAAVSETGGPSPYTLDAVEAALRAAQAVVVILTGDDRAQLRRELTGNPRDPALEPRLQPRPNVFLEAGMSIVVKRHSTLFVRIGDLPDSVASDLDGVNYVALTNAPSDRTKFRNRLGQAGCEMREDVASDFLDPAVAGDFEEPWRGVPSEVGALEPFPDEREAARLQLYRWYGRRGRPISLEDFCKVFHDEPNEWRLRTLEADERAGLLTRVRDRDVWLVHI